jgi:hypothetical protein
VTEPLSLPLAADVIVNHEALLVAVQLQPALVVTFAVLDPPAAVGFSEVGATLNVHGAPCCVTTIVCPATVNVPVRGEVEVLAAML